jgi:acetyl-CoA synthetase
MPVSQSSDISIPLPLAHRPRCSAACPAYADVHRDFTWAVPEHFNIAQACCARWAARSETAKNIAIHAHFTGASDIFYSFAQLQEQANRLSNVLSAQGVMRGDRVAIVMPQCFETAVAYMAVLQMGAVAMPLSLLFGPTHWSFACRTAKRCWPSPICLRWQICSWHANAAPCLRTVMGVGATGRRPRTGGLRIQRVPGAVQHPFHCRWTPWRTTRLC